MPDQDRAPAAEPRDSLLEVGREALEVHGGDRRTRAITRQVERQRTKPCGAKRVELRRPGARRAADAVEKDDGRRFSILAARHRHASTSRDPHRTGTFISPMRSNFSAMTSPGFTGATPWQVPDMMMSPG
jgi:hypothetical protein